MMACIFALTYWTSLHEFGKLFQRDVSGSKKLSKKFRTSTSTTFPATNTPPSGALAGAKPWK
jgi:hypothetical protein